MRPKRIIICASCKEEKEHYSNGMCETCYQDCYYLEHREERSAYKQCYYQKNRKAVLARTRIYQKEHREECNARSRRCWRRHREERLARALRWQKENPEKAAANAARYRARKRRLPDTLTNEQIEQLLAIGHAMYPGEKLHLDHIVPVSRGGGTTLGNMGFIPATLNLSKHDKLPEEVYEQLTHLVKRDK